MGARVENLPAKVISLFAKNLISKAYPNEMPSILWDFGALGVTWQQLDEIHHKTTIIETTILSRNNSKCIDFNELTTIEAPEWHAALAKVGLVYGATMNLTIQAHLDARMESLLEQMTFKEKYRHVYPSLMGYTALQATYHALPHNVRKPLQDLLAMAANVRAPSQMAHMIASYCYKMGRRFSSLLSSNYWKLLGKVQQIPHQATQ